jgi:hypothetical protein
MGYSTDFDGGFEVVPPLNEAEFSYLKDFADSRRMDRENGPYFVKGDGIMGQDLGPDSVWNSNKPPAGQPGLWCQWIPTGNGGHIEWDGGEKFYHAEMWIKYLIEEFLEENPDRDVAAMVKADERFKDFTFNHVVNGLVEAQGEDPVDRWDLIVEDNVTKIRNYMFVGGEIQEL